MINIETDMDYKEAQKLFIENKSAKHILTLQNIHDWLVCYGFVVEQEYGDYDKNPIMESTHRAIIYAIKVK